MPSASKNDDIQLYWNSLKAHIRLLYTLDSICDSTELYFHYLQLTPTAHYLASDLECSVSCDPIEWNTSSCGLLF